LSAAQVIEYVAAPPYYRLLITAKLLRAYSVCQSRPRHGWSSWWTRSYIWEAVRSVKATLSSLGRLPTCF